MEQSANSNPPSGIDRFVQYATEGNRPANWKATVVNLAHTALSDTMEGCKPSRYLLDKSNSTAISNTDDDDESMDAEVPESDGDVVAGSSDSLSSGNESEDEIPETYVSVNGRLIAIWEYLGTEWTRDIQALHNIPAKKLPAYLLTQAKPWQLSGSAKMQFLAESRFHGGILGDEQGLGKTLTILDTLVADIMNRDGKRYKGFDLIVTSKTCITQWADEIKRHFGPEIAATAFLLDDPTMTANELLDRQPNFVLCTYQFVQSRWRAYKQNWKFFGVVEKLGLEKTLELLKGNEQPNIARRHINSLFSPVYRQLRLPIRHLVLDEAQYVKNPESSTNEGIRNLYYESVLMLTGTFVPNRWYDIYGLVRLLDGHAFKEQTAFIRAFGGSIQGEGFADPTASKEHRLVKFLQAFIVSRPVTLLELQPLVKEEFLFELANEDADMVSYHVDKLLLAVKLAKRGGSRASRNVKTVILGRAALAQQWCASPSLIKKRNQTIEEQLRAQGRKLLDQFLTEFKGKKDIIKELIKLKTVTKKRNELLVHEDDDDDYESDEGDDDYREDDEEDDDSDYDNFGDDADNDPDDPDWTPEDDNGDDKQQIGLNTEEPESRAVWVRKVRSLPDDQLLTPKIIAILDLIHHIRQAWPGEKVVIFSKLLRFLDLLDEAIRRNEILASQNVGPLRFDGTCDIEDRKRVRTTFAEKQRNDILLITPGAGGAGLNLIAGSKIIQCEVWWNATEEKQAYSRCHRLGQTLTVHVWLIRGVNSIIDDLIEDTKLRKSATNDPIVGKVRHKDDEKVSIPRQFKHGIGQ